MISDFLPERQRVGEPVKSKSPPNTQSNPPLEADERPFKTPEEVAVSSPLESPQETNGPVVGRHDIPTNETGIRSKLRRMIENIRVWWTKLDNVQRIMVIVAVLVVIGLAAGLTYVMSHHKKVATVVVKPKISQPVQPPKPIVSNLTGLPISDAGVNLRPVTGVMIENSLDARPQSGLDSAGIVFEAVAEAGITRFLALYQDTQPSYLGPVRSARPYYVAWDMGFDAPLAHVGGSPEALNDIKSWGVHDLDEFYNGGSYERISKRIAPHNVYTSASQLNQLETSKGFTSSNFTGFVRKPDTPLKTPNVSSIDISPSSADYNSHYDYVATTNNYKRSEGGSPHMVVDANGNQTQITPKVIVAMVMQQGLEADDHHTTYNVVGSGQVFVFQDGTVTNGTWQKTANNSQITFLDATNKPMSLNAGQTWLVAVGSASLVAYK